MAAPNIDVIAASLRSCSIAAAAADSADTTLDLNSEIALPYHWEQCLDLKTGKIYYINWSTGAKSTEDPRRLAGTREKQYEDEDDDGAAGDDEEDDESDDSDGEESSDSEDFVSDSEDYGDCSSAFSSSSSSSSWDTVESGRRGDAVLVAAGCRVCMMYVMIPKREEECPRCGGHVMHFSR
ncbi:protein CURLY FLAG LEAF 1-like [Wolffia australiana]